MVFTSLTQEDRARGDRGLGETASAAEDGVHFEARGDEGDPTRAETSDLERPEKDSIDIPRS